MRPTPHSQQSQDFTSPGVPVEEILRDIRPFLLAQAVVVAVLVFFPQTVLWLPAVLGFTV